MAAYCMVTFAPEVLLQAYTGERGGSNSCSMSEDDTLCIGNDNTVPPHTCERWTMFRPVSVLILNRTDTRTSYMYQNSSNVQAPAGRSSLARYVVGWIVCTVWVALGLLWLRVPSPLLVKGLGFESR